MYSGGKLKQFRISKGLNQNDLSIKLNVSQSYYSKIEKDKKPITENILQKIEEFWGTKKEYFEAETNVIPKQDAGGVPGGVPLYAHSKQAEHIKKNIEVGSFFLEKAYRVLKDMEEKFPDQYSLYSALATLTTFESAINILDRYYFQDINNQLLNTSKYGDKKSFDYKSYRKDYFTELDKLQPIEGPLNEMKAAILKFYSQVKDFDKHGAIEFMLGEEEPVDEEETTGNDWQDFQNARSEKEPPTGSKQK